MLRSWVVRTVVLKSAPSVFPPVQVEVLVGVLVVAVAFLVHRHRLLRRSGVWEGGYLEVGDLEVGDLGVGAWVVGAWVVELLEIPGACLEQSQGVSCYKSHLIHSCLLSPSFTLRTLSSFPFCLLPSSISFPFVLPPITLCFFPCTGTGLFGNPATGGGLGGGIFGQAPAASQAAGGGLFGQSTGGGGLLGAGTQTGGLFQTPQCESIRNYQVHRWLVRRCMLYNYMYD